MALSKSVSVTVSAEKSNSNQAISDFWDQVDSFLMTLAEEELGLTPGSGSIEEGTVVSLSRGETITTITGTFPFAGQWTKD